MLKKFASFFVLLISIQALAWSAVKPTVVSPRQDVPKIEGNKTAQACLLRSQITSHLDYVVQNVLGRGSSEAEQLVKPQLVNGQEIRMGEAIEYADLYHFHLRYPVDFQFKGLADFQDSLRYHLHYHTFEHLGLMFLNRLYEVRDLGDAEATAWAQERIERETTPSHEAFNGHSSPQKELTKLDPVSIDRVAVMWNQSLGARSPGIQQLTLWMRALNDRVMDQKALSDLLRHRSVASHDTHFEVIPGLDLPNIWQPIDIMFAPVESYPNVARLIQEFKTRTGQKWLGNLEGIMAPYLITRPALNEDSISTWNQILAAIDEGPQEQNILRETVLDLPSHRAAFAVDDKYIYSLRVNLASYDCP